MVEEVIKTKVGEYVIRKDLMYTDKDEWVKTEGETLTIGITDYAQKKLRYIVSVELAEPGKKIRVGEPIATLESVKAIADVYAPATGEVVEVNEELKDRPELINSDPYGKGWVAKIKVTGERSTLLTPEEYAQKILKEESS
ncbi:MAG: glycine cleavage system protein H [Zestosphaera tikiterensis]|uniref:Probable glycine cleavage system H protein n=1 Tax=Zestosphaera tikiterensis TaxID=1973259 RepID=A0A2R7Y5E9_9CREN|nr:MAG: glycine cleavage system protein H [Zestosphaera tikiterensis]